MIKQFSSKKFYVIALIIAAITLLMAFAIKTMNGMDDLSFKILINGQSYPFLFLEQLIDLIPILLIILLGGLISDEYRDGTLKLVLIRPINRGEVLISKFVVMVTSVLVYMMIALVSSYIFGTLIFGWGENFFIYQTEAYYHTIQGIYKTLVAYGMTVLPIVAFMSIILFLSILLSNSGMVLGVGIGLYFLFQILLGVLGQYRILLINTHFVIGRLYILAPLEINLLKSLSVISLYIGIMGLMCFMVFQKKDIVC